ncbi:MAG: hypothetical protein U1E11_08345 [Dethiobacteria bacterium]|nr:hypothetical protein [Dethiobacteria bacterium]
MTDFFEEYDKVNPGQIPRVDQVKALPDDEFSELDYRPPKISFIRPFIVILLVLAMVVTGVVMLLGNGKDTAAENSRIDLETPGEDQLDGETADLEEDQPETDFEPTDESEETDDEVELLPPNYDLHEAALHEWLKKRVDDPSVILLPAEALDDFDRFFELYDLEEDNVIVYQIETADAEFVTAVLGVPFSEWSLKAVFIWRGNSWAFLREEAIGREQN